MKTMVVLLKSFHRFKSLLVMRTMAVLMIFLPRFISLLVMKTMAVLMKSFHKDKQVLVSVYEFACSDKAKKLGEALPHSN